MIVTLLGSVVGGGGWKGSVVGSCGSSDLSTSAMLSILGERERPRWLWLMGIKINNDDV